MNFDDRATIQRCQALFLERTVFSIGSAACSSPEHLNLPLPLINHAMRQKRHI